MLVYHVTNVLFVAFSILGAAARTEAVFLASRFLSGFVGVATIAVASGTIADVMQREERGRAVAVWSVSTILGPMVGAVLGGYVAEVAGWRWLFWGVGVFVSFFFLFVGFLHLDHRPSTYTNVTYSSQAGIATLLAIPILKETNHAVLLSRKAARLRKETGNKGYRSKLASPSPRKYVLMSSIARPIKLLLLYPVVTILCGYVAILYAIIYLLFSTYSFVFSEVYGFSPSAVGLVFVSGAAGTLAGVVYVGYFSDEGVKRGGDTTISITTLGDEEKGGAGGGRIRSSGDSITTTITTITTTTTTETEKKRKTKTEPESRLPLTITLPGTLLFPAGLFLYGWAVEIRTHWAVPLLGTATTGFASTLVFVAVQAYLIDAFEEFAASAVGANVVLRGIVGAVMPLGGMGLYRELGWGWGNGVLGFVSLGLAPLLVLLGTGVFGGRVGRRVRGFRLGCWEL